MSKRWNKDKVNQVTLTAYLAPVQKVEVMPRRTAENTCDNILTKENDCTSEKVSNSNSNTESAVTTNNIPDEPIKKRKHNSPEESHPLKRSNTQDTPPYNMAELKLMEDRLHTSLTLSLTTSLTQNLREELKEIVNDSIKGAVDTLNRAASKLEDCSTSIQKHDEEIKGLKEKNDQLM